MLASTDLADPRLDFHQYPRHLASCFVPTWWPATEKVRFGVWLVVESSWQQVGIVLWDLEYPLAHLRLKRFKSCNGLLGKDPVFRPIEKGWDYTGVE